MHWVVEGEDLKQLPPQPGVQPLLLTILLPLRLSFTLRGQQEETEQETSKGLGH